MRKGFGEMITSRAKVWIFAATQPSPIRLVVFQLILFFTLTSCFSTQRMNKENMTLYALRLLPGQDLKIELDTFAREKKLQAGFVITCVGSLHKATLRPADQKLPLIREQKFEIVSLTGTLSPDGSHLHIALSDSTGTTVGGHLLEGCEIYTTAEIVIGEAMRLRFSREVDAQTLFRELKIKARE